jgi:hypothetical protein
MDLIFEIENHIPEDLCKDIVSRFDHDERKIPGMAGGGYMPQVKESMDLGISRYVEWEDVTQQLEKYLEDGFKKYQEFIGDRFDISDCINHTGYQVQKSGKYKWHEDSAIQDGYTRIATFIWYLNEDFEGGETGFVYKKVTPKTGKFVMFPGTWAYQHCGFPTEGKYIATGWLWRKI